VTRPTPEEREYARLWLSECWAPVPEWRQTRDERADAETRNARYAQPGDESVGKGA
jgi:hypothetical protein